LNDLHNGDDWAFVIKAQTLVEEVINKALLANIGDERLYRHIK